MSAIRQRGKLSGSRQMGIRKENLPHCRELWEERQGCKSMEGFMSLYLAYISLATLAVLPTLVLSQSTPISSGSTGNGQEGIAASAEEICPLKVGTNIPPVTVRTIEGSTTELSAEVKKAPTVLIFYRGGWCVYCNTQMQQLRTVEAPLKELGYQLIAVSPDRPEKLRESIDKHALGYRLFSDSKMTAAKLFGLAFRVSESTLERYKTINIDLEDASGETHRLLPVPAVFIVGMDGIIRFSYVNPNYRVRIDPDVLLAAAKAALKEKS